MHSFILYVDHLNSVVRDLSLAQGEVACEQAETVLNGHANQVLKSLVPISDLRSEGVFFSSRVLAERAAATLEDHRMESPRILDPMCGSGDLLLACARRLKIGRSVGETLETWSDCLIGRDLHSEFVDATKARLTLLAFQRHNYVTGNTKPQGMAKFSNLRTGCGVSDKDAIRTATHIILNPPFKKVLAPPHCEWTSGSVNSAAVIFMHCVDFATVGTRIVAILPDVLPSGTRYEAWRKLIASKCKLVETKVFGRFDGLTDVDVFVAEVVVGHDSTEATSSTESWFGVDSVDETLGDHFDVRVGPVVNYRDPNQGSWSPFLRSRELPSWSELNQITRNRRFNGTLIDPPFIAIRRTSRPDDRFRAVGCTIASDRPVAVENHIIVLEPKSGELQQCRNALGVLRDPRTSDWLNQRIRCRHLTTSAIAKLPWWPGTDG